MNVVTLPNLSQFAPITTKLEDYADQAEGAFAEATQRAIQSDTKLFATWCADNGVMSLPATPESIRRYIDEHAELHKPATVRRRVSSIAHMHNAAGLDDPTKDNAVKLALKRMNRTKGTRQRQARPINETDVAAILATTGTKPTDLRDIALLLTARDLLARRSEVVALNVDDVTANEDGSATALIQKSKTDQEGAGAHRWLSPRTVNAIQDWLAAIPTPGDSSTPTPLFPAVKRNGMPRGKRLSPADVARRFKIMAKRAGINAEMVSGHSCRVGMAQDLVAAGTELPALMTAGRWKSAEMPAKYTERLGAARGAVARYYETNVGE